MCTGTIANVAVFGHTGMETACVTDEKASNECTTL